MSSRAATTLVAGSSSPTQTSVGQSTRSSWSSTSNPASGRGRARSAPDWRSCAPAPAHRPPRGRTASSREPIPPASPTGCRRRRRARRPRRSRRRRCVGTPRPFAQGRSGPWWTGGRARRDGPGGAPRRPSRRTRGSARTRPASRSRPRRRSRAPCRHRARSSSSPCRPSRSGRARQVQIDDLCDGGEPSEVGLEVQMVEAPRPAVQEDERAPLTHPRAVRNERRAVDVEPQARPVHVDPHGPGSIANVNERDLRCVVLVEGVSDWSAIEALAGRRGRDLDADGVSVVPIGGAQAIGRFLERFGPNGLDVKLAGLATRRGERLPARPRAGGPRLGPHARRHGDGSATMSAWSISRTS